MPSIGSALRALIKIEDFGRDEGFCYTARLPPEFSIGDTSDEPSRSPLELFEDGVPLGPPHSAHAAIRSSGSGRFSHWGTQLYFSTSDNSDPPANRREYHAYLPRQWDRSSPKTRALSALNALPDDFSQDQAYSAVEQMLSALYPEAKLGEIMKSFWRDEPFLETYRSLSGKNYRALERKYTVANLIGSLHWVDGDLAECGVYNGATAFFMALASQRSGRGRELCLFDSFAGLSLPERVDGDHWRRGDLAIAEEIPRKNLARFNEVRFYAGWIPDRFAEVANRRFCFVHVDVDLYRPTRDSISFFYPRLNPGGMMICDDYGFDSCPGARRAMDEYFADRPERIIHLPTGQGLIIRQGAEPR